MHLMISFASVRLAFIGLNHFQTRFKDINMLIFKHISSYILT